MTCGQWLVGKVERVAERKKRGLVWRKINRVLKTQVISMGVQSPSLFGRLITTYGLQERILRATAVRNSVIHCTSHL